MHYLLILTALFTADTCESAKIINRGADVIVVQTPKRGIVLAQMNEDLRFKDTLARYDRATGKIVCITTTDAFTQSDIDRARNEGRAEVKAAVADVLGRF